MADTIFCFTKLDFVDFFVHRLDLYLQLPKKDVYRRNTIITIIIQFTDDLQMNLKLTINSIYSLFTDEIDEIFEEYTYNIK